MVKGRLNILGAFISDQLKQELEGQGHNNTGALKNSIRHKVVETSNGYEIQISGLDYAKTVDQGQPKGTLVDVFELAKWVEQRGIASGEKEVKQAAFAIRRKIMLEGSPTKGSFKFSKNGRRKEFISVTIEKNAKVILNKILSIFKDDLLNVMGSIVKQASK